MTLLILVPFTGAVSSFLLPNRYRATLGLLTLFLTLFAALRLAFQVLQDGTAIHFAGGWEPPLGIALYADGLSAIMVVLTAIVGLLIGVYAARYFRLEPTSGDAAAAIRFFWPLYLFLLGALNALFLSADLFNSYVLLELSGLSAVALAALASTRSAYVASLRYLLAAMIGALAYLLGVGIVYAQTGTLQIFSAGAALAPSSSSAIAVGLMMVGLFVKTALFPLHFWLPPAHSNALTPVSALLSALVIKGSFFVSLRIWFVVFENGVTVPAAQFIGCLGAAAIVWGSYRALRQQSLKLLVAHSTVSQVGYLFLLFPLTAASARGTVVAGWTEAWVGGIYTAISHAFAKSSMFLATGVILYAKGRDRLSSLRNIGGRLPVTTFALGLSGMTLIGLPPSGGFVSKWMYLKAIFLSGQWWWIPIVFAGSLLTAGYVFLMLRYAFEPAGSELELRPAPRLLEVTALLLALAGILIGFWVEQPINLLETSEMLRGR